MWLMGTGAVNQCSLKMIRLARRSSACSRQRVPAPVPERLRYTAQCNRNPERFGPIPRLQEAKSALNESSQLHDAGCDRSVGQSCHAGSKPSASRLVVGPVDCSCLRVVSCLDPTQPADVGFHFRRPTPPGAIARYFCKWLPAKTVADELREIYSQLFREAAFHQQRDAESRASDIRLAGSLWKPREQ